MTIATVPRPAPRVVSLVPSATQMLRFMGVEPVGISHCCEAIGDHAVVVTSSSVPDGLSQAEIDAHVSRAFAAGDSLYRIDDRRLSALQPDLVITQGVCDVCAVGADEVTRAQACLPATRLPTLFLNGTRLDDLWSDITAVANRVGLEVRPQIEALKARLADVDRAVAGRHAPRVAVVEWLEPPFLAGHWVPCMIRRAGGVPIGPESGVPSPRATWDEIIAAEPDVLLYSFCGYDLASAMRDVQAAPLPPLPATRAVHVLDAGPFCALTPAVVRGVEILAALLHPGVLPPPHPSEAVTVPARP